MRIWKVIFTVLTIISVSLGLMNIISYDVTMPIMFVFMGLTLLTNAKDCYDKGALTLNNQYLFIPPHF